MWDRLKLNPMVLLLLQWGGADECTESAIRLISEVHYHMESLSLSQMLACISNLQFGL